jgi:hypothetical protein
MRKDIECTFKILKGRWWSLKTDESVSAHGTAGCDMLSGKPVVLFTTSSLTLAVLVTSGKLSIW